MSRIARRPGFEAVDFDGFPVNAGLIGKVWKLFVEPVVGSGERLIAGVLVRVAGGESCRLSALNPRTLESVYGPHGLELSRYTQDLLCEAEAQFGPDPLLENWQPAYGGFTLEGPMDAQGDSAMEIARGEILMGASFALWRGRIALFEGRPERSPDLAIARLSAK